VPPANIALEQHYRVNQIAQMWGWSRQKVIARFENEPNVLITYKNARGKRTYRTISIPESVLLRVHRQQHVEPPLQKKPRQA